MQASAAFSRPKAGSNILVAMLGALLASTALLGAGGDAGGSASATFRLGDEVLELHHAVAFRTTALQSRPGAETTVVVLTKEPLDEEAVAQSVKEKGNWTGSGHVRLTLRFDSDGHLVWGMFQGGGNNLQLEPERIASEVEVASSSVRGTLSQKKPSEFFGDEFLLEGASFDLAILEARP